MDNSLINTEGNGLMGLLHGQGGLTVPQPFERDIFLFDCHIAGTTHVEGIEELEPYLKIDDRVNFFREPDNGYDPNAIVIKNSDGVKLGYVPMADNVVFSRLMDAGKMLFGKISSKEWDGTWLKIDIKIYLHE
ncbi:MAG: HIRAN domain-containing protein [Clostridiales bacterium]|nr:HIRAN domain-containing protein [Clostridiales bacterium]MCD7827917.1 HIRAN domain-containing protein [Clostridiales bacterium]